MAAMGALPLAFVIQAKMKSVAATLATPVRVTKLPVENCTTVSLPGVIVKSPRSSKPSA